MVFFEWEKVILVTGWVMEVGYYEKVYRRKYRTRY